jgi:hypothetical protein
MRVTLASHLLGVGQVERVALLRSGLRDLAPTLGGPCARRINKSRNSLKHVGQGPRAPTASAFVLYELGVVL